MLPDLGKYAFAVLASYGAGLACLGALCLQTYLQSKRVKIALAEVEARSGGKTDE